jgi:hypothetical protein
MKLLKNDRDSSMFFQELNNKKKKEEIEYYKIYRNHRVISGSSFYSEITSTGKEFVSVFNKHKLKKRTKIFNIKYCPYTQETKRVIIESQHNLNNDIEMKILNDNIKYNTKKNNCNENT